MKSASSKISILIFVVSLLEFSNAEQPDRVKVEAKLGNVTMDLINKEGNLTKTLTTFGLQVKICSSNLKASNLPKNFTDVLDNLMTFIQQVQTINDHQALNLSFDAISSYDYTQYRIATSFSDIKRYTSIIESIQANETKLYAFAGNVTKNYVSNYMKFIVLKSKDKTVMATIRQFLAVFSEFGSYTQLLTAHIGNLIKINSYLTSLIVSKTVIAPSNSSTSSFMTKVRAIESSLVPSQESVISKCKVASNKITIAENSVASRVKRSSSNYKDILASLKSALKDISSVNDYPLVGWPQLPDLPADGKTMSIKLRSSVCDTKESNFENSNNFIQQNRSRVAGYRDLLNASTSSVASSNAQRKVQAQSQLILDVIGALGKIDDAFVSYKAKVDLAITEIKNLRDEVNTPETTTTTKATTTTNYVLPNCGTFIPYDPVTDRDAPVRYGILAGTYSDGSPIYVGRGDNTAYLGMNLTSARVSIDPKRPGLYMTTASGEVFRDTNATFLANHSSIMWIKVNASTSFTHPYAIKWMSGRFPMLFGRVNVSGYTAVGRVHYGNGLLGLHVYRPDLNQVVVLGPSEQFEIVACKAYDLGCYEDEWYNPLTDIDYPLRYGLPAGIHFDGSVAYVGRVYNTVCFKYNYDIARVSTSPSKPGAFLACANATDSAELYFNASTIIELRGNTVNLKWVKTNGTNVKNVPNFQYYDSNGSLMGVGRYQLNNYTVVGKVYIQTTADREGFHGWNPELNKYFQLPPSVEFEVVACA